MKTVPHGAGGTRALLCCLTSTWTRYERPADVQCSCHRVATSTRHGRQLRALTGLSCRAGRTSIRPVTASALELAVPLLAICRGMQALNVCRGGTLHQHVEDLVGHVRHDGPQHGFGRHSVHVAEDSLLASVLPSSAFFDVPTHHHQAVDLVGDGLQAVAWEEDGLIEAVEAGPSELGGLPGFVLGVQWHPEQGSDPRLFAALVAAAAERAAARISMV